MCWWFNCNMRWKLYVIYCTHVCVFVPWLRKSTRESAPGIFFFLTWYDFFLSYHVNPMLKREQPLCKEKKIAKKYSGCFAYLYTVKEREVAAVKVQLVVWCSFDSAFSLFTAPIRTAFSNFIPSVEAGTLHSFVHQNLLLVWPKISHFQVIRNSHSKPRPRPLRVLF